MGEEEHKRSISAAEAFKLGGDLLLRVGEAYADDQHLSKQELLELFIQTAKDVFTEYMDEDDV